MPCSWPPFPRDVEADASAPALRAHLSATARPLWREAATHAPVVPLDPALATALANAARDGTLVLGLEAATAALDREGHGLAAVDARATSPRPPRISRLLLLADDGAERFYRAADRTMRLHATRVLPVRVTASAEALGHAVLGRPAGVKAVLVQHKQAVAAILRALARPA